MAFNAGAIIATLKLDTSNFERGVKSAGVGSDGLSSSLSGVALAAKVAAAAAVVAASAFALKLGKDAVLSASRIQELTLALNAIAKANDISSESVEESVNALRDRNIAYNEALQITAKFVQADLDLADTVKLSTAAQDLAVIAGLDSSDAMNTLTDAIVSNEAILLRQFGIVTTVDKVLEEYGETVGKTSGELTEAERKQAFLNTILEAGIKVTGTYEAAMGSASKQIRSLTGRVIPDFIAQLGLTLDTNTTLNIVVKTFSDLLGDVTDVLVGVSEGTNSFSDILTVLTDRLGGSTTVVGQLVAMISEFLQPAIEDLVIAYEHSLKPAIEENKELFEDFGKILIGVVLIAITALVLGIKGFIVMTELLILTVSGAIRVMGFFRDVSQGMRDVVVGAFNAIGDAAGPVLDKIRGVVDAIIPQFEKVANAVQRVVDAIVQLRDAISSIGNIGNTISNIKSKIPGFADGVTNFSGGVAMVGERGPELVNLPRGSNVIPNNEITNNEASINIGNVTINQDTDLDVLTQRLGVALRLV